MGGDWGKHILEDYHEEFLELYQAGWSDTAIAKHFFVHPTSARRYRKHLALPMKRHNRFELDLDKEHRRRKVHAAGHSDQEASQILGMPKSSYRSWRLRRGLPPNREAGTKESQQDRGSKRVTENEKAGSRKPKKWSDIFDPAKGTPVDEYDVLDQMDL